MPNHPPPALLTTSKFRSGCDHHHREICRWRWSHLYLTSSTFNLLLKPPSLAPHPTDSSDQLRRSLPPTCRPILHQNSADCCISLATACFYPHHCHPPVIANISLHPGCHKNTSGSTVKPSQTIATGHRVNAASSWRFLRPTTQQTLPIPTKLDPASLLGHYHIIYSQFWSSAKRYNNKKSVAHITDIIIQQSTSGEDVIVFTNW
jgi:hypothetical protein